MSNLKIGFIGINSPTYYAKEFNVYEESIKGLKKYSQIYGYELVSYPKMIESANEGLKAKKYFLDQDIEFLFIQNSSFSMGDVIESLADKHLKLGLWAVSEPEGEGESDVKLHSLVSMNMYASIIQRCMENIDYKWFYGHVESDIFLQRFHPTILAIKAIGKLKTSKICWVGNVAPTFDNLLPDLKQLNKRFGIQIDILPTLKIKEVVDSLSEEEIKNANAKFCKEIKNIHIDTKFMKIGASVYGALSKIANENEYDGMALSCWPDFQDIFGIVPCVPFTELYDIDHIPVSCEGDLQAVITMIMLNEMTNNQSMTMDFANVDIAKDMLLLWHCGIGSKSMATCKNDISIINHPMINRKLGEEQRMGLSYDYYFKNTDVSIARITNNGEGLFFLRGSITDQNSKGFTGTRGWINNLHSVDKKVSVLDITETIMHEGVEHHLIIVEGNCTEAMSEFAYWTKSRKIEIETYKNYR